VIPTAFLFTGLAVYVLKPKSKEAVLLALLFGMFTFVPYYSPAVGPVFLIPPLILGRIVASFFPTVFLHFFLIFPERSRLVYRFPRVQKYLYIPYLVLVAVPFYLVSQILAVTVPEWSFALQASPVALITRLLVLIYIVGGLIALVVSYIQASPPARQKIRVVLAGILAGFVPILLAVSIVLALKQINSAIWFGFLVIAFSALLLVPLSFGYAIIRHQVIPVGVIIRRSVRYLLVSRGFTVVGAVFVFAGLSYVLTTERVPFITVLGNRTRIFATMAGTLFAVWLLKVINHRIGPIIDRRFFREKYDAQQMLADLGESVHKVVSIEQLVQLTLSKIQDALHAQNVTIFLRDDVSENYLYAGSSPTINGGTSQGGEIASSLIFPHNSLIVSLLAESAKFLAVDFEDSESWIHSRLSTLAKNTSCQQEIATLQQLRPTVLLPIATREKLLGIISLGPRLGDLPYSRGDTQMLMSLAWQIGLAIENASLLPHLAEEERLKHELEMAAEVQRRLLPEIPPSVEWLELFGRCIPVRGVGGDYYDFILFKDGLIGIVIADVAGKGMPAALLMSAVQACLRTQAQIAHNSLPELVGAVNRQLWHSTGPSSYATFFYAQFDQRHRNMTYINAGHNAPMLVRANHGSLASIWMLNEGGPVIGMFEACAYEEATIELKSGDLIIAYTDGLTEALNSEGEEYGDERLRKLISSVAHLSAHDVADNIEKSVSHWSHGAAQHDDLTFMVVKIK
jgi:sigma-B regulation protein RsbU (phosphoserine phosphatase)